MLKFGLKYLTAEDSFAGKNRAVVLSFDELVAWIEDHTGLVLDYDMRVEQVA